MKHIIAALILVGSVLVVGVYATNQLVSLKQQEIRNQALHDCAVVSSHEWSGPDGSRSSVYIEEVYQKCKQDKGY